jgi:hypothetical protein
VAVPQALALVRDGQETGDDDLEASVLEALGTMAEVRAAQGGADAVTAMLENDGVRQTVVAVMTGTVGQVLEAARAVSDTAEATEALSALAETTGDRAGLVLATMDDASAASESGAAVVSAVVSATVIPEDIDAALTEGAAAAGDPGEAEAIVAALEATAAEQGTEVTTQPAPGRWSRDRWGTLLWGQ